MGVLWKRTDVRGHDAPKIRRAGLFAWQVFDAMERIAKELNEGGYIPDEHADGFELAHWNNLPGEYEARLEEARERLIKTGAIERVRGGYQIPDWEERQERGKSTDRVRRFRERKRAKSGGETGETVSPVSERSEGSSGSDRSSGSGNATKPDHTKPDHTPQSASRSRAGWPEPEPAVVQDSTPGELFVDLQNAASNPEFVDYGRRLLERFNELTGKTYEFKNARVHTMAFTIARFGTTDGQIDQAKLKALGRMLHMVADPKWRRSKGSPRDWANFTRVFGSPEKTENLIQDSLTWGSEVGAPPADPAMVRDAPPDDEELERLAAEAKATHHRTGRGGN